MSGLASAPPAGEEDDPDGTRVLTVNDVLEALDSLKGEVGGHAAAMAALLAQQEAAKAARHEARQELLRRLADEPHRFGFFAAVRLLENAHPHLPRVGTSLRLRDDPIRFAQAPSLSFAPATIARFAPADGDKLPTLYHSLFNSPRFPRFSDDKFFISIESRDPKYDTERTRKLLESTGAAAVEEVEE